MPMKHVDVEGLVTDWAWDYFRRKATSEEKKLIEKEQIRLDIDWKRVRFTHQSPKFDPEPPTPGSGTPKVGTRQFVSNRNQEVARNMTCAVSKLCFQN